MSKKDRAYLDWIARQHSCSTCGSPGVMHENGEYLLQPSHVKSRGSGGGDLNNVIPQCWKCHEKFHRMGQSLFQLIFEIDLKQKAKEYYVAYTENIKELEG